MHRGAEQLMMLMIMIAMMMNEEFFRNLENEIRGAVESSILSFHGIFPLAGYTFWTPVS